MKNSKLSDEKQFAFVMCTFWDLNDEWFVKWDFPALFIYWKAEKLELSDEKKFTFVMCTLWGLDDEWYLVEGYSALFIY